MYSCLPVSVIPGSHLCHAPGLTLFVLVLSAESADWGRIWLERMLPVECGLVSRQRPLIDTLPNVVGLKYKSSSPLPGTKYTPCPAANFHSSFPAARLCASLSHLSILPASVAHNHWLRPAVCQLFAPFHIYLGLCLLLFWQPVSNCVFSLLLVISPLPPAHSMLFFFYPHLLWCVMTCFSSFLFFSSSSPLPFHLTLHLCLTISIWTHGQGRLTCTGRQNVTLFIISRQFRPIDYSRKCRGCI